MLLNARLLFSIAALVVAATLANLPTCQARRNQVISVYTEQWYAAVSKERPPAKDTPNTSIGSGFLVTHDGHVLTNAHVVEGCSNITVRSVESTPAAATIIARNEANDLAVLKTFAHPPHVAPLRVTSPVRVGEAVVVYGFPLSGLLSSSGNAVTGDIAATTGIRNDARHFQISAPLQLGNSGGPLLDMKGNVIGVVVSKLNAIRMAQVFEDIPQNISFAIKVSVAANFLDAQGMAYEKDAHVGNDLSVPDVVEIAKALSVEVRCEHGVSPVLDGSAAPSENAVPAQLR